MGQPPIETYAGSIASAGGRARPVLMTGSFAPGAKGHDTLISLKAEAQNVLAGIEPFAPDGSTEKWWDFGVELLGNVDAAAAEGDLGVIFADHVRQIGENLGIGQAITSFTGGLSAAPAGPSARGCSATWPPVPRAGARRGDRHRRRGRRGLGGPRAAGHPRGHRHARAPAWTW